MSLSENIKTNTHVMGSLLKEKCIIHIILSVMGSKTDVQYSAEKM